MSGNNQYKAQQFIDVIPRSGGIISTIARKVGCNWHTAKKYIDKYPTIKRAYDDECEKLLDAAESVIVGDIVDEKDTQTAKWYLKMKGSRRGYAQRRETVKIDLSQLTEEQLERIAGGEDPFDVLLAGSGSSRT